MSKEIDNDIITCWCGAQGTFKELFSPLPYGCGGSGLVDCDCGGDQCVCHWHGETECPGCEECDDGWEDCDYLWDDPDEEL